MNISGVLVCSRPEYTHAVREKLNTIAGVEVHAATEDGQLVVTVENDAESMFEIINSFHSIDGLLSTSLIYNHFDEEIKYSKNRSLGESI